MPWKRIGAIAAIVVIGVAFLAGYLPEHRMRTAAEQESLSLGERLRAAEAHVRMGQLLGEALTIREIVMRQNYGQAQELSSSFFDRVRQEASTTPVDEFRTTLEGILARRDSITASLTKASSGVLDTLNTIELQLRRVLGYPLPPETVTQ
jgi:hypothetical protein